MQLFFQIMVIAFSILVCWVIPIVYIFRTNNFKKGFLLSWGLSILNSVILSIPVYEVVWRYNRELVKYLPEGNSIIAAIFMGWLQGALACGLAYLLIHVVKIIKGHMNANCNQL
jgi:hypothetical protein